MKLKSIVENNQNVISQLSIDHQKHIADDMEDLSRVAMNVSNAIYSGSEQDVASQMQEFDMLIQQIMQQINQ